MNEEVMIPKSYHDKVCEEIIRFKDNQFYDAVHLLDDGTLEIHVTDYKMVKRVLVEDDNNFGNLFCEDKADRPQGWIPCSERLPETDNTNEINEFDVLLAVRPKKHPKRTPQVYIGKLRPVEGDDGSGNFWGVKIAPCEWTIWGWSYFQEPEVLAWMPLPQPMKGADDEA